MQDHVSNFHPATTRLVHPDEVRARANPFRHALSRVLRLFSSIWLGVILLTLLFIYCSIGSSGVPTHPDILNPANWVSVRQMRPFELTEFEWFHWWPFNLLIGLICVNLIVATLRRIPFNIVNLGVWMIHSGIIILALGSVWYFGTKVEGEAPVTRRRLVIEAPGIPPTSIAAAPGAATNVGSGENAYSLQIIGIDPQWELLSGEKKGQRAYKVSVAVRSQAGMFIRDLIAGDDALTTDLVASNDPNRPMDRAINVIGKPLVDEALKLTLDYEPQRWFYLVNSHALYLREAGSTQWIQRPIDGLPRYNDYLTTTEDAWPVAPGERLPLDPIDVAVPPRDPNDPLPGVTFHVNRYLRYATLESRWWNEPQGEINPRVEVTMAVSGGQRASYDLLAFDPQRRSELEGNLMMVWASSAEEVERLKIRVDPAIRFTFPALGDKVIEEKITATLGSDPELAFKPIEGTEYAYRVESLDDQSNFGNGVVGVAIVQIKGPQRTFTRWVFSDSAMNQDLAMTADPASQHDAVIEKDANIESEYHKGTFPPAPMVVVAGPVENDLGLIVTTADAQPLHTPIAVGGPAVDIARGVTLRVERYAPRSVEQTRPLIVPREQRERNVEDLMSMVHLSLPSSSGEWLRYHHFAFDTADDVLRRFPYRPSRFEFNGKVYEIMFSRERLPLPAPVVLDNFAVDTHIGGFTGDTSSIMDWVSLIRFQGEDGQWLSQQEVRVNQPSEFRGHWFFQAQWDPPDPARAPGDVDSRGLNYTVLGVGNRHGVYVQLVGCTIAVLGMLYAFYAKPIIKRRRHQAVHARLHAMAGGPGAGGPPGRVRDAQPEPVGAAWRTNS